MKSQGFFPDNCEKSRKWKSYVSGKKEPVNTAPNLLKSPITGKVEFFALRLLEKICLDILEFKFSDSKLYILHILMFILDYLLKLIFQVIKLQKN